MNASRLPLAVTSVGAALLFVTGCSGTPDPGPVPPSPPSRTRTAPAPRPPSSTVSVTGSVTDGDGGPASLVVLSFDSSEDGSASRSTISGPEGDYRVNLRPGHYTVSCTSLHGACSPADSDGDRSMGIEVTSPDTVDFIVESRSPQPDPRPDPRPDPQPESDPPAGDLASQCRAGGYNVCGRVTQGGRPVAGVILEAKFEGQHQEVRTNDNGLYAMKMQMPDAVLLCEGSEEMMNDEIDCSAVGESQPIYLDSSVTGRIVNFAADAS